MMPPSQCVLSGGTHQPRVPCRRRCPPSASAGGWHVLEAGADSSNTQPVSSKRSFCSELTVFIFVTSPLYCSPARSLTVWNAL